MIDLHYWPTPNGHKITIFLEEAGVPYKIIPVNITKGDQMAPSFLALSPNNKMPAIFDRETDVALFESGAILQYLAKKTKKFIPEDELDEARMNQWLFWQVAGLGPMSGQAMHFSVFAKEKIPYAITRYVDEVKRLYRVMNEELGHHTFLGSDTYSIADMACYPWVVPHEKLGLSLADYPHIQRWVDAIKQRPAVIRAYAKEKEVTAGA